MKLEELEMKIERKKNKEKGNDKIKKEEKWIL